MLKKLIRMFGNEINNIESLEKRNTNYIDYKNVVDVELFNKCMHDSDTYFNGVIGRKAYIDGNSERLCRIINNILSVGCQLSGPTLDVASGWGILYPCIEKYISNILPYSIAEMVGVDDICIDGNVIKGSKFECDKDRFVYTDNEFGVILFCDCLEHLIVDPVWTILEFNRVLRLGGHLILTTPNAMSFAKIYKILRGENPATESEIRPSAIYQRHNREWTPTEILNLMKCCGFDNCKYSTNDFLLQSRDKESLMHFRDNGILNQPVHDFGPELFIIAEKVEHVTVDCELDKDRRWPEWLYTSYDSYRKRPNTFPIIIGNDYA